MGTEIEILGHDLYKRKIMSSAWSILSLKFLQSLLIDGHAQKF